ncbi:HNH endonuclease [Microlunatus endophyticus]
MSHAGNGRTLSAANFKATDRVILRENYRKLDKNASCDRIRNEILESTKWGRCPYCRLEEATTLDHILEKEDYPEFSILRLNLAPVCSRCNTLKQTNKGLVAGHERLHLYFSGYPMEEFLVSRPVLRASSVAFKFFLRAPSGIDPWWWDAIEAHFVSLDLAGRYERRAQVEMQDRRDEMLRVHAASGGSGVQRFLQSNAQSISANWSREDWLSALLIGAAGDTIFCNMGVHRL